MALHKEIEVFTVSSNTVTMCLLACLSMDGAQTTVYSDILTQAADSGIQTFFSLIRRRHKGWVNSTLTDYQL